MKSKMTELEQIKQTLHKALAELQEIKSPESSVSQGIILTLLGALTGDG